MKRLIYIFAAAAAMMLFAANADAQMGKRNYIRGAFHSIL